MLLKKKDFTNGEFDIDAESGIIIPPTRKAYFGLWITDIKCAFDTNMQLRPTFKTRREAVTFRQALIQFLKSQGWEQTTPKETPK